MEKSRIFSKVFLKSYSMLVVVPDEFDFSVSQIGATTLRLVGKYRTVQYSTVLELYGTSTIPSSTRTVACGNAYRAKHLWQARSAPWIYMRLRYCTVRFFIL